MSTDYIFKCFSLTEKKRMRCQGDSAAQFPGTEVAALASGYMGKMGCPWF